MADSIASLKIDHAPECFGQKTCEANQARGRQNQFIPSRTHAFFAAGIHEDDQGNNDQEKNECRSDRTPDA